jgi:hypothetical protein
MFLLLVRHSVVIGISEHILNKAIFLSSPMAKYWAPYHLKLRVGSADILSAVRMTALRFSTEGRGIIGRQRFVMQSCFFAHHGDADKEIE